MARKPAPVLLFTYNRPDLTASTVEALLTCPEAPETALYIFSDAPANSKQDANVEKVRRFIKTISGFAAVRITERETNLGLARSIISGVSEALTDHDSCIVLEDDLLAAPNFLTYMNQALELYGGQKEIFSVSGYGYPFTIPADFADQVYLLPRPGSWGWATWKDRWEKAVWDDENFRELSSDKALQRAFNRGGEDLTPMMMAYLSKHIDSWAIRWSYILFKENAFCVYPVRSKIVNIGVGSPQATHTTSPMKRFAVEIDDGTTPVALPQQPVADERIIRMHRRLMRPSLLRRLINAVKYSKLLKRSG